MSGRSPNRWRERFADKRPIVVAHRGDSARAPKIRSRRRGLGYETGAGAWELDVRLSRDNRLVVIHDAGLSRTTDAPQRLKDDPRALRGPLVNELDLAEILELDAGTWFIEAQGGPRSARFFGTRERLSEDIVGACRSGSVRVPTCAKRWP